MTDVTIWWGVHDLSAANGGPISALAFADDTGLCKVETLSNVSTSKKSSAAPELQGATMVPFIAFAVGGLAWLAVGADPTAVAKAAGAIPIPADGAISGYMPAGSKLAAIAG